MGKSARADVKTGNYFSGGIYYLGITLVLPGIFISKINIQATLPFFLISLIVMTTHYGVTVDVAGKLCREYVWFLGLKTGTWQRFDALEYIFINRNKESQAVHTRINTRVSRYEVYDGFLKFSEAFKVHLGTSRDKDRLLKKLKPLAASLSLDILDYSDKTS